MNEFYKKDLTEQSVKSSWLEISLILSNSIKLLRKNVYLEKVLKDNVYAIQNSLSFL